MSFPGLLLVAFIVLKLMGYIAWSWVWVLSPIWITFLVVIAMYAAAGVIVYLGVKK